MAFAGKILAQSRGDGLIEVLGKGIVRWKSPMVKG